MSKVIDINSDAWYQEVAPRDFYLEIDLERIIMHNLSLIFPDFIPIVFKADIIDSISNKKNRADLCLIKRDYSEWYVIEVELGKHSKTEVLSQIETFSNGIFDDSHAKYIYNKNKRLNLSSLTNLVTTVKPELMVIVNEVKSEWKKDLKKFNCKMCVFQIYNEFSGKQIFRIEGEHPFIYTDFRNCLYEKSLPYAIKILKDEGFLDSFGIKNGDIMEIEYNGVRHKWERNDDSGKVYLICKSLIPPLDSLTDRYRLNYFRTGRIQKSKNISIINKCRKIFKKKPTINYTNSFSFTKD
ncbi:hypothetical protein [Dysgonomonas sp.]